MTRLRSYFIILPFVLLLSYANAARAHTPHDVIGAIQIGSRPPHEKVLFIIMGHYRLLRSVDHGASWQELNRGLEGGSPFTALAIGSAFDPGQTLFAATDGDGIYRSRDAGDTWQRINSGLSSLRIEIVAMSPSFASKPIALAVDQVGRLYRTEDGGDRWQPAMTDGLAVSAVAFAQTPDGHVIWAGDRSGRLHRSVDSGHSWQMAADLKNAGRITCIAASPDFPKDHVIMVGTTNAGLFRSGDGGQRFRSAGAGITDVHVRDIAFSPDFATDQTLYASCWHEAIFRSEDGGRHWTKRGRGLTTNPQAEKNPIFFSPHFRDIRILPDSDQSDILYLAGFDGLFHSTDRGANWRQLETEAAGWIFRMSVSPAASQDFWIGVATNAPGVFLSRNAVMDWSIHNAGLKFPRTGAIRFSPDFVSDRTLYSYVDEGDHFLYMDKAQDSWQAVELADSQPLNFKTRILGLLNRKGVADDYTLNFLSTDERRQLQMRRGRANPKSIVFSPDFAADRTIYVGTRKRGIFRSTDGGRSFEALKKSPLESWSLQISPSFKQDGTLFSAGRAKGIFKSEDAGRHWHSINQGLAFFDAPPPAQASSTHDRKERMRAHYHTIQLALSPDYPQDRTLWAYGGFGLYRSVNGGQHWRKMDETPSGPHRQIYALAVSPDYVNDRVVLISVKGRGLYKSSDSGEHFALLDAPLADHFIRQLAFSPRYRDDGTILAASETALFRSRDDGRSWRRIQRPVRYENEYRQGVLSFTGSWELHRQPHFSAGTASYGISGGAKAVFHFNGSGARWIGEPLQATQTVHVRIDGRLAAVLPQTSTIGPQTSDVVYEVSDLRNGPHRLTIDIVHPGRAGHPNHGIAVDAFDVLGSM